MERRLLVATGGRTRHFASSHRPQPLIRIWLVDVAQDYRAADFDVYYGHFPYKRKTVRPSCERQLPSVVPAVAVARGVGPSFLEEVQNWLSQLVLHEKGIDAI